MYLSLSDIFVFFKFSSSFLIKSSIRFFLKFAKSFAVEVSINKLLSLFYGLIALLYIIHGGVDLPGKLDDWLYKNHNFILVLLVKKTIILFLLLILL